MDYSNIPLNISTDDYLLIVNLYRKSTKIDDNLMLME